jgi:type IV secretion system protein VirB9
MRHKTFITALLVTSLFISSAQAAITPQNGGADPRVKHVVYHEQDVTEVKGHYGYTTSVEFGANEKMISMSIGDSIAWQVQPAQDNLLFMKPLEANASTNLTVITNKHIYSFELSADVASSRKSSDLTYRLRFVYPDEEAAALATIGKGPFANTSLVQGISNSPSDWNFKYQYSGNKNLRPVQTFDNGRFTYFKFSTIERAPAIFVVDDLGNESLVNYHKEGDYLVVERLARQFTLRDGEYVTCIFNESFPVQSYEGEPLAPVPVGDSASDEIVLPEKGASESSFFSMPADAAIQARKNKGNYKR